ncbi:MAG: HipA N-terminal domain-containing protein [Bacteroidia bacterium]
MKNIERLVVALEAGNKEIEVGELVYSNRKIYFKYYPQFIDTGIQISPFKLPLSSEILIPDTMIFEGLFGVFNDSLPDGWGRLLLDRTLLKKGIPLNQINPLARLAFVGRNGMGALTYKPPADRDDELTKLLGPDAIATETKKVLEGNSTDIIDTLFTLESSSGGARPANFVGYDSSNDHLINYTDKIPKRI